MKKIVSETVVFKYMDDVVQCLQEAYGWEKEDAQFTVMNEILERSIDSAPLQSAHLPAIVLAKAINDNTAKKQ